MKRIILSLVIVTVAVIGIISATTAYFTSQNVLGANTIASGTLNVSATSNGLNYLDIGTISKLAPEDITPWYTIVIKNEGDINATTFGKFDLAEDGGLASALKFYDYKVEYFKADGTTPVARWTTHDNYYGTAINEDYFIKNGDEGGKWAAIGGSLNLTDWTNIMGPGVEDVPPRSWDFEGLKAGYSYKISFRLQMDPNAGNAFQNKYINLGYQMLATQVNPTALAAMSAQTGIDAGTLSNATWGVYGMSLNQVNTY